MGQALLQGEWAEAVRLLLTPREDARPEVQAACKAYLEKADVAGALQQMPRHLVAECAVLQVRHHGCIPGGRAAPAV